MRSYHVKNLIEFLEPNQLSYYVSKYQPVGRLHSYISSIVRAANFVTDTGREIRSFPWLRLRLELKKNRFSRRYWSSFWLAHWSWRMKFKRLVWWYLVVYWKPLESFHMVFWDELFMTQRGDRIHEVAVQSQLYLSRLNFLPHLLYDCFGILLMKRGHS